MRRIERKVLRLNDEIHRLREEERLVAGELDMHGHLDDDARRDAAVGGPAERREAYETAKDVDRFRAVLQAIHAELRRLEQKRDRLLDRMGGP
ncbi:MAG: hypothetical protein M3245_04175 [Actinomycetota bacterium]|nr:hypothetical protein [Actinomycetota bacterium]